MRFTKVALFLLFAACLWPAGARLRAETIDMNKIHEQWGEKPPEGAKFWADDPKTYAAAQQVSQTEVSKSWGKRLVLMSAAGLLLIWLFLKARS